jgi:hypothetical protein
LPYNPENYYTRSSCDFDWLKFSPMTAGLTFHPPMAASLKTPSAALLKFEVKIKLGFSF